MENTVTSIEQRIEENFKEGAQQIKSLNRKTFRMGGVHPDGNKFAHSAPVETFPLPDQAVVYMTQHLGAPATPIVQKGDKVKVGQLIGEAQTFMCANIHSPISGTVNRIDMIADISGYKKPAIVIDREGDEWDESIDTSLDIIHDIKLKTKEEIIERMKDRGIVGLGASPPTSNTCSNRSRNASTSSSTPPSANPTSPLTTA